MDVLTSEQRSKNMRAIKNKNTRIENLLAHALWTKGYRYRRNLKGLFGTPDIVFTKAKIAIFCDSEFFHGKNWENARQRIKTNTEFWVKKIENNIQRDQNVNLRLKREGWIVLRFWGEDIEKHLDMCVRQVEEELKRLRK